MACPYAKSEDGFELQLATNHLSHFLLTNLLIPKLLLAGPNARVINVSSCAHIASDIRYADPNFQSDSGKDYKPFIAYAQSKTANVLFSVGINERLGGKGIHSFALHPGSISSGLQKFATPEQMIETKQIWESLGQTMPEHKTLEQGCSTSLRAALDPGLVEEWVQEGKVYLNDCQLSDDSEIVNPFAVDKKNALKSWALSEDMVGEKFRY